MGKSPNSVKAQWPSVIADMVMTNSLLLNMAIYTMGFPRKHGDFPKGAFLVCWPGRVATRSTDGTQIALTIHHPPDSTWHLYDLPSSCTWRDFPLTDDQRLIIGNCHIPSGRRLNNYGKIHHFSWEKIIFLYISMTIFKKIIHYMAYDISIYMKMYTYIQIHNQYIVWL